MGVIRTIISFYHTVMTDVIMGYSLLNSNIKIVYYI